MIANCYVITYSNSIYKDSDGRRYSKRERFAVLAPNESQAVALYNSSNREYCVMLKMKLVATNVYHREFMA